MPSPHFRTETEAIKLSALASMQAGRDSKLKKVRRSVRRSMTYGGGKKKAAKIAIGVGFGAIFVGISVATAGVATPALIAGLAVGSWAVGQMTDAGFAKLGGRKYRGGRATNEWVEKYTMPDNAEKAKALEERAHKTVRRTFEHYRRSIDKAKDARSLMMSLSGATGTCDEAADVAMSLMSLTRHLEKARIYAYPGLFLAEWVLEAFRVYANKWNGEGTQAVMEQVDARIKAFMEGHQGDPCSEDGFCFVESKGQHPDNRAPSAQPLPPLWTTAQMDQAKDRIDEARDRLDLSAVCAPPASHHNATRLLYQDAGAKYERRRTGARGAAIKTKHGITSVWARKTHTEKKSYAVSQTVGAGLSAGSAGIGGALFANNINLAAGWEFLIEGGFQVVGNLGNEAIDRNVEATDASQQTIDRQKHGSAIAAEAQDYLRKAAVHIWEAQKIVEALGSSQDADIKTCDDIVARLRELYKVRHHLTKAQAYLGEGIAFVVLLATKLAEKIEISNNIHRVAFTQIDMVMRRGDHSKCGKVCYTASVPRYLT